MPTKARHKARPDACLAGKCSDCDMDDLRHTFGQAAAFLEAKHWPALLSALGHAVYLVAKIQNNPRDLPTFRGRDNE